MSKLNKNYLIDVFSTLGSQLSYPDEQLNAIINDEYHYNAWFTPQNVGHAVRSIGKMLDKEDLTLWLGKYEIDYEKSAKRVGLILAGNIPLVGFHDVLCVLITGNHAL